MTNSAFSQGTDRKILISAFIKFFSYDKEIKLIQDI